MTNDEHRPCVDVTRHGQQIKQLEKSDGDQWKMINQIRNRLPHWATMMIGVLMGLIGFLIKR